MANLVIRVNGVDVNPTELNGDCIYDLIVDGSVDFSTLTTVEATQILNSLDFTQLTAAQCEAIGDCVFSGMTATQITALTQSFDFSQLTVAQQTALKTVIENLDIALLTVNAGTTAVSTDNANGEEVVQIGDILHFWSADGNILFNVSAGSAVVEASLNPTFAAGLAHTAITNINLRANDTSGDGTGTIIPNEYVVDVTWTDENGNTNVTTDPTPITISSNANSNVYSSSASIVDIDAILAARNAVNGEGQTFSIVGSGSRTFSSSLPINVNANGTLVNIPANSSVAIPAGAFGYYFSDGSTIWFSYQLVENSAESGDASNLNGATQDLTGNLLSLLPDRVSWHFHTRQATEFTAPSMNVTADGEDIAVGVTSHTIPDGAQGFAIRVGSAYQVMYQTLGTGASTDPISTEVGNLIILGDDGEEYALPEVDRECAYYTVDGNPNKFNNSDTSPSVETITTDLTFDLTPTESYLGNTLTIQMFGGNPIPVQETYILQIIGGSVNELRPINPIGSGNLVWDISGIIFQNGVTYSCTILNSAGDDVRVDNIPSANNFLVNTSLSGGAIPVSIFNGTTIAYYTEITYSDGETSKTIYVEDGSITPLETQPTGTRVAVSCLSSLDKTEITELINKQNKDFVRTSCFEEVGATLVPVNNAAFADEINPTQLATLPAGAHMRWVSQTERVLNTLQVNGFGDGVAVISWLTESGVSGSGSVTFTGGNPYDLALGDLTLAAGEYIDFTLESLSVGQMQLTTESASIANGWIALQDYSAFAPATSHWATTLLTSEPNITHKVNLYEDDAGTTIYKEIVGDDLTIVDVTGWTEIDCLVVVETTCTDVTETFTAGPTNNGGTGTGPTGLAVTSITINEPQDITITHTGTGFTGAAGSGFGVSSIPVGDNSAEVNGSDIYTSGGDRIFQATPSKTYTISLPSAGKYYIGVFSGGLSSVTSHTLDITYCKPDVVPTTDTILTKSIDCYQVETPTIGYDGRTETETQQVALNSADFSLYSDDIVRPLEGLIMTMTNNTASAINVVATIEDLDGAQANVLSNTVSVASGTAEYTFTFPTGTTVGPNNLEGWDITFTPTADVTIPFHGNPSQANGDIYWAVQSNAAPMVAWILSTATEKVNLITNSDNSTYYVEGTNVIENPDISTWVACSEPITVIPKLVNRVEYIAAGGTPTTLTSTGGATTIFYDATVTDVLLTPTSSGLLTDITLELNPFGYFANDRQIQFEIFEGTNSLGLSSVYDWVIGNQNAFVAVTFSNVSVVAGTQYRIEANELTGNGAPNNMRWRQENTPSNIGFVFSDNANQPSGGSSYTITQEVCYSVTIETADDQTKIQYAVNVDDVTDQPNISGGIPSTWTLKTTSASSEIIRKNGETVNDGETVASLAPIFPKFYPTVGFPRDPITQTFLSERNTITDWSDLTSAVTFVNPNLVYAGTPNIWVHGAVSPTASTSISSIVSDASSTAQVAIGLNATATIPTNSNLATVPTLGATYTMTDTGTGYRSYKNGVIVTQTSVIPALNDTYEIRIEPKLTTADVVWYVNGVEVDRLVDELTATGQDDVADIRDRVEVLENNIIPTKINKVQGKVFDTDADGSTGALTVEGNIISATKTDSRTMVITHPSIPLTAITQLSIENKAGLNEANDLNIPVYTRDSDTQMTVYFEETAGSIQNISLNVSIRQIADEYNVVIPNSVQVEEIFASDFTVQDIGSFRTITWDMPITGGSTVFTLPAAFANDEWTLTHEPIKAGGNDFLNILINSKTATTMNAVSRRVGDFSAETPANPIKVIIRGLKP